VFIYDIEIATSSLTKKNLKDVKNQAYLDTTKPEK